MLLVALVLALVVAPEGRSLASAATLTRSVGGVLTLLGALVLYMWWRDADRPEPAWLIAAPAYLAAQSIVTVAMRVSDHPDVVARPGWLGLTQLVAALVLVGMVAAAHRVPLRADPLVLGLSTAGLAVALQLALMWGMGPLGLPTWALGLVAAAVASTYLVSALVAVQLETLPHWARLTVGGVAFLLAIGVVGSAPVSDSDLVALVAGCAHLAAGLIVVMIASALLHRELRRTRRHVGSLTRRLEKVEHAGRDDRARLHEVRATLAGISTASQLLHDLDGELDEATRVRLQRTVRSEMARMQRLMEDRSVSDPADVDLDETLDPVLEAHRARGHDVRWHASGQCVHARPDDVAEAVNILLENAAKHARGQVSHLGVARDGDDVLISVTDTGPGIPARLRHQIFDWGVSGDASTGQGIGLYVARRLVSEQGGSLTVTAPPGNGTTFTIRLPAAHAPEENHDRHPRTAP
ncbi:ATP-binding protein [Nocardioides sp. GXQ0305]|uniref:sensor histidine kinase n=1 Tax=Nocardioides sp. GXQ0305 TaxID=3423912 RepID=UPI003D7CB08D